MGRLTTQNILKSLVRIPSSTGDAAACQKIVALSQTLLRSQKVPSKIEISKNRQILVWGEINLSKSKWLVNSHLDVVPGKPSQFKPLETKDKILGRGAADTKGSAAILLSNASSWLNAAKAKRVTFMLVTDEEMGGESTKEILRKTTNLKGAIFLEPTDEKIITQTKGIMQIKIQTKGKSCHGSRPWEGINALEQLTSSLTQFRKKHPNPKNETQNTTFNFSILQAGTAINQIPEEATLWCDVRWNSNDSPNKIINELKHTFVESKVEVIKLESPVKCSEDAKILADFFLTMKQNKLNPIQSFDHGSSDARHCTARNIPAIIFGPKGKNSHADNEWVSLKSLDNVGKVLNSWINQLN
ncbi:hypothetical protein A2210_02305 [Candidatus Woesebacteria bacterium RIFOXYA1_FULL_40_18]|nr:MAG: hypothetical protein A2210_02305 [Candidatus Woesebacteria bacterium RIFOXYA1_FULL_40_18]OGM86723.1 MAG: hypothetical protein A2614_00135 [Candidatus Woesebacteria bacterium RIFOXYD1_FULL_40_21]